MVGLVYTVCFGLVWFGWFGLVNEDGFKRPKVPVKEAKAKLELPLGPIPGRSGLKMAGAGRYF